MGGATSTISGQILFDYGGAVVGADVLVTSNQPELTPEQSAHFTGSDAAYLQTVTEPVPGTDVSLQLFAMPESEGQNASMLEWGAYRLALRDGKPAISADGGKSWLTASAQLPVGRFSQLTAVFDTDLSLYLYIDGEKAIEVGASGKVDAEASPARVIIGRGYVATVLVQNGTLHVGDFILAGTHYGKVKAMFNERNQRIKEAGPATPALILGLNGAPTAGDTFNVLESEQEAKEIANKREQLQRELGLRTKKILTLEDIGRRRAIGNFQELNIIVKGDVDGSIEALSDSLIKLSTEEIQINVLHKAVGEISESDVTLAAASDAIIIGFQVRPSLAARRAAERDGVEIRLYSVIYQAIEEVKDAMEGMLAPEIKEEIVGTAEVLQTYKISKVGTVAGCMVREGRIKRSGKIRLIRDGIVRYTGELGSLKRFKDDVKEVVSGYDCGLNINGYNDIREGDIVECFEEVEVKKSL